MASRNIGSILHLPMMFSRNSHIGVVLLLIEIYLALRHQYEAVFLAAPFGW